MTKHRLNLRKVIASTAICFAAFFVNNAMAQPGTYNAGDIAVINNIIANNGLDWTPAPTDGSSIPADWTGCSWTSDASNKRITYLDVFSKFLNGTLNVSGLNNLQYLSCYYNQLTELDLKRLNNLVYFYGIYQSVSITMEGNGTNFTAAIVLNNPENLAAGITYNSGILTSISNTIASSNFEVQTGFPCFTLSGALHFTYTEKSGIKTILSETATVTGYFDLLGKRLQAEPTKGLYIVQYNNGTTKKIMK